MTETPGIKRLFWDIETSPNVGFSWRIGSKVFLTHETIIHERQIMCICWKWEGEKKVYELRWTDNGILLNDKAMVRAFERTLFRADEVVAHNGDSFDIRWYNGRHIIHGLDPIPASKTVDTYKMAARHLNLNCHKLDYLAKILFGERKIKTDYEWWRECHPLTQPSRKKRKVGLDKMVRYCKKDVVLLERVWNRLRDFDPPASHAGVFLRGDQFYKWSCPHCASLSVIKAKTRVTAKGTIQHQMKCKDCGRYYVASNADFRRYQEDNNRR